MLRHPFPRILVFYFRELWSFISENPTQTPSLNLPPNAANPNAKPLDLTLAIWDIKTNSANPV